MPKHNQEDIVQPLDYNSKI